MRDLNEIQCFVRAVELKSLTAAARSLNLPKSSVSRKIAALEQRLGLTLLTRSTRALHLTEAGRPFYESSARALKELDDAEHDLDSSRQVAEGLLRVTAPVEFTTGPFTELIAGFLREHPRVKIDLLLTERMVDLIGEGVDVAFRLGDLQDSTLIAKNLGGLHACIVASPAYFKSRPLPRTLKDLESHDCIAFAPKGVALKWLLKGPGGKKTFTPDGRFTVNHFLSIKTAVLQGMGIAMMPNFLIENELKDKSLRQLFPEWQSQGTCVHLVFPGQKFLSPKLRAFIDYTTKKLTL